MLTLAEIRATSEALRELAALDKALLLLSLATQTGLVESSMDAIERIREQRETHLRL